MISKLKKLNIVICGGDHREIALFHKFKEKGLNIKLAGFGNIPYIPLSDQVDPENLTGVDVLILPVWGIDDRGRVSVKIFNNKKDSDYNNEELLNKPLSFNVAPLLNNYQGEQLLVLTGSVSEKIKSGVPSTVNFALTAGDEEFMQLNSIPTAEGAIMKAMEVSPITIHSSRCLVFGFGKCGITLALALKGLGANVTAIVRRVESRAYAYSLNINGIIIDDVDSVLGESDFIFNTVPDLVLPRSALQLIRPQARIFDIASYPGGVDLEAARSLDLDVYVLPGLPGRVAPVTAGEILADVYPRIIVSNYYFNN